MSDFLFQQNCSLIPFSSKISLLIGRIPVLFGRYEYTPGASRRYYARVILLLLFTVKFFYNFFFFFFESVFPKIVFLCVPASENQGTFSERCSLKSGVSEGLVKVCKKYMEFNSFLLLSCSTHISYFILWW